MSGRYATGRVAMFPKENTFPSPRRMLALALLNASARAMAAFSDAALTLQRLRTGGRHSRDCEHITVKDGGQAVVAQIMNASGNAPGPKAPGENRRSRERIGGA